MHLMEYLAVVYYKNVFLMHFQLIHVITLQLMNTF